MTDDKNNVFADEPDDRQLNSPVMPDECKLFRKRYRQLTPAEIALHDAIKDKADELAALIALVKPNAKIMPATPIAAGFSDYGAYVQAAVQCRLQTLAENDSGNVVLALRHLEDCVYRAVKALTA